MTLPDPNTTTTLIDSLSQCVAAAAGLGTASFALVDATKAFWGGVSNFGFGRIDQVVKRFFDDTVEDRQSPLGSKELKRVLQSNWLNGTALGDQKAIAKAQIKLRLSSVTAKKFAVVTGLSEREADLISIAAKLGTATTLTPQESDLWARFDLILTTILDQAYERADQIYRNATKAVSVVVSVGLSIAGFYIYDMAFKSLPMAILVGLAATPIAPIAKDLTSALAASVKVVETFRK